LIEIKNKIKRGERFFNLSPCRIPTIMAWVTARLV